MRLIYIPKKNRITPIKYGLLYNWYAATDARDIANVGWKVPDIDDFNDLKAYINDVDNEGSYLKEIGTTYWDFPNLATNLYNFNGRGSGGRGLSFVSLKKYSFYLTTYSNSPPDIPTAALFYDGTELSFETFLPWNGGSIRLIKTITTLTHGQTSTYQGNDGKFYRTICIGTQEWLADNLAETKYRTGDTIPEVTDNAAWAALTTGALCAYNNDWSNV